MTDLKDCCDAYRIACGKSPMMTESGKSEIVKITYTVVLEDEARTQKDIISNDLHAVGDRIFDPGSGIYGKILRADRTLKRVRTPG